MVGGVEKHLTVGRVAELAGVSVRTLHHYDEIGLVQPSARTSAGYRAYSAGDVERLREVLAYRRLGFGLREIADLVDDPATDAVAHLRRLRGLLLDQRDRAAAMVTATDRELEARAMGIRTTPEEQLKVLGAQLYDTIGSAYPATRRTEPRIAARVWAALGDARTVLNVGAGTGSYEPTDRDVTAVEPSAVMRAQRPADGFFEAHWRRPEAYLDEHVRRAVSVWARVGPEAEQRAVNRLRDDLSSGRWAERNRDLVALDAAELGLRLLVA
ncbi:MerR family transcriptional regulator [Streptomyces sp. NPDC088146]|uniref:MerR family transcriptional regulator n=1 Tax=Streptomyces sp. NPDC088146 TaxID=3365829 RepID=UPI00381059B4